MIYIDNQLCNGCGICVDVCPTSAIVMRDNKAFIKQNLCEECQACINECPQRAILLIEQLDPIKEQPLSTIPTSKTEVLHPKPDAKPVSTSWGAAIVEVLPRLASLAIDWLEHRPQSIKTSTQNAAIQQPVQNISRQNNERGQGLGRAGQGRGRGRRQRKGRGNGQGQRRQQERNRR
ncbi:MAG: 4Fe-4S binding protein [Chloroflexota bacterium]|nr:4Fe-4S binding protein [Chloroflexota bacterium]